MKNIYQLICFDDRTSDFKVIGYGEDFNELTMVAVDEINNILDRNFKFNKKRISFDELLECFENGQTYIISDRTFGIIDITKAAQDFKTTDYLILIESNDKLTGNDIKSLQMPFKTENELRDYMSRFMVARNGVYRLMSQTQFDEEYDIVKEQYNYIIHANIKFK